MYAQTLSELDLLPPALACKYLTRIGDMFHLEIRWFAFPHCILSLFVPFFLIVSAVESQSAFTAAGETMIKHGLARVIHDLFLKHHANIQTTMIAVVPSTVSSVPAPAVSSTDAAHLLSLQQEVHAPTQRVALLDRGQLTSPVDMSVQLFLHLIQSSHAAVHWCTFSILQIGAFFDWTGHP